MDPKMFYGACTALNVAVGFVLMYRWCTHRWLTTQQEKSYEAVKVGFSLGLKQHRAIAELVRDLEIAVNDDSDRVYSISRIITLRGRILDAIRRLEAILKEES